MDFQKYNSELKELSELKEYYGNYFLLHTRPMISSSPEVLFRARVIDKKEYMDCQKEFPNVSSIWYREWKNVPKKEWDYNRCSTKGQNFFYASNSLEVATVESVKPNSEFLLIGEFKLIVGEKIRCQLINVETLKEIKGFELLNEFNFGMGNNKVIEEKISKCFTVNIEKLNSNVTKFDYYKDTISISDILLKGPIQDAIIYPSVKSKKNFLNYGIKPQFVDANMFCANIYLYRIIWSDNRITLLPRKYGEINREFSLAKEWPIVWKSYESINGLTNYNYEL